MTDPIVSIRGVTKKFGDFVALEDINIDIVPGEIFALLGPSGCGKSTLLRIIAGFESPTEGSVLLDGKDMTNLAPNRRPINMVFQSYAVFPHMSVTKNVAYGLKMEGLPKTEIDQKVAEALEQVHLTQFADRMPDQLSGGQRQRVALARALVKRPRVLLLDEPLSALDAKLRDAMRLELVKLQDSVGITFVIVTHDQSEALGMADRVAVLEAGRLRQLATPEELYQRPCDAFVADFIGNINFFDPLRVEARGDQIAVETAELGEMVFPAAAAPPGADPKRLRLAIRPEKVKLSLEEDGAARLRGRLGDVAFQGQTSIVEVELDNGRSLTALVDEGQAARLLQAEIGTAVWCAVASEDMLLLPR
jgi:spermidine/putrescine transport system ATP-binding protein/putrescine transport system ATP-binding protein